MTQKSLIYSKTIKIYLKNKVFINKIKIMKKVVRLNESDIVRLVKKVISENKKLIKENPADLRPINSDVVTLKATQWKPEIEATYSNGFKQIKKVKATITKGGVDVMTDKDVNMYNIWSTNDGGIGAQVVTGECKELGVPKCLTQVSLSKSEAYSLTQHMKDFKPYTVTKENVSATVVILGKPVETSVTIKLTIG